MMVTSSVPSSWNVGGRLGALRLTLASEFSSHVRSRNIEGLGGGGCTSTRKCDPARAGDSTEASNLDSPSFRNSALPEPDGAPEHGMRAILVLPAFRAVAGEPPATVTVAAGPRLSAVNAAAPAGLAPT